MTAPASKHIFQPFLAMLFVACLTLFSGCMERDPAGPGMHSTAPWADWQAKRAARIPPPPAHPTSEHQSIAEACLEILGSPASFGAHPDPGDPRLPAAIRELHPREIEVAVDASYVVVRIPPENEFVEYLFTPLRTSPGNWQLLGVSKKIGKKPKELCRVSAR